MGDIILIVGLYLPVIIFTITSVLSGTVKVLDSNLYLGAIVLSGLSIVGLFGMWVAYQQLGAALISIISFILMIWFYSKFKGIENQIILVTQEEIKEGNYTLTPDLFYHVTYKDIGRTIDILKAKGLVSNKVMYEEILESSNDDIYEREDSHGDAISNFEKRHNLRR